MSVYFMCRHGIFFYKEDSVYYKSRKGRKEVKLEKIVGEEEVEKMDGLLSLAITGGDCNWI